MISNKREACSEIELVCTSLAYRSSMIREERRRADLTISLEIQEAAKHLTES